MGKQMADAHAKPHHDYHLVNPSPWPIIGSIFAFLTAVGLIMSMKDLTIGGLKLGPFILVLGFAGILYVMAAWWRDVIHEAETGDHTRVVQISHRYGMILFIASEVMFFVAWFWAFFDASLFTGEKIQYARVAFTGGIWPPKGSGMIGITNGTFSSNSDTASGGGIDNGASGGSVTLTNSILSAIRTETAWEARSRMAVRIYPTTPLALLVAAPAPAARR